jgi:hypothetical protein
MAIGHPAFCGFFQIFLSSEGTLLRGAERIQRAGGINFRCILRQWFRFFIRVTNKKDGTNVSPGDERSFLIRAHAA